MRGSEKFNGKLQFREPAYTRTRITEITRVAEGIVGVSNFIVDRFHHLGIYLELKVENPENIVISHAESKLLRVPYEVCYQPSLRIGQLVGLPVKKGLYRRVKEIIGGPQGCVHLVDLTVDGVRLAMQAVAVIWMQDLPEEEAARMRNRLLGGVCIAYPKGQ